MTLVPRDVGASVARSCLSSVIVALGVVAVGIVLSIALGLGVLFLYLYTTHATTILFGNVLGVDRETV